MNKLEGIVIDDTAAKLVRHLDRGSLASGCIGDCYVYAGKGTDSTATFEFQVPKTGKYEVRMSWQPHENRATLAPVVIRGAKEGEKTLTVNSAERGSPAARLRVARRVYVRCRCSGQRRDQRQSGGWIRPRRLRSGPGGPAVGASGGRAGAKRPTVLNRRSTMSKRSGGPARRPATIKPNLQKKMRSQLRPVVKISTQTKSRKSRTR